MGQELVFVDCEEYIPPEIFKGMLGENGKMLEELDTTHWNPIIERVKNGVKDEELNKSHVCHRVLDLLEPLDKSTDPNMNGNNLIISTICSSYAEIFQDKGFFC